VAQAGTLLNPSPAFYNGPMIELAGLLTANSVFDRVFFANTGAEANEGAIKLARKWGQVHKGGAYEIITFDHSFHGRTLATMSASGKPGWDTMYAPQVPGFPKADLNDIASVKALINEQHRGGDAGAGAGRRRRDPGRPGSCRPCARSPANAACC
jgi:acetylornithine/N-succinyldiaminopimelate aminotransferase